MLPFQGVGVIHQLYIPANWHQLRNDILNSDISFSSIVTPLTHITHHPLVTHDNPDPPTTINRSHYFTNGESGRVGSLGRVLLALGLDLRLTGAALLVGDVVHDGGDVLAAPEPGGLVWGLLVRDMLSMGRKGYILQLEQLAFLHIVKVCIYIRKIDLSED